MIRLRPGRGPRSLQRQRPSCRSPPARWRIGRYRRTVQLIDVAASFSTTRNARGPGRSWCGQYVHPGHRPAIDHRFLEPPARADEIGSPRTVRRSASGAGYQQTADRITEMGDRARAGLAIVFSRADLIGTNRTGAGSGDDVRKWDGRRPGAPRAPTRGRSDFRDVALFHTSPSQRRDHPGRPGSPAMKAKRTTPPTPRVDQPPGPSQPRRPGPSAPRPASTAPIGPGRCPVAARRRRSSDWYVDDLRSPGDRVGHPLGAILVGPGGYYGHLDQPGRNPVGRCSARSAAARPVRAAGRPGPPGPGPQESSVIAAAILPAGSARRVRPPRPGQPGYRGREAGSWRSVGPLRQDAGRRRGYRPSASNR